MLAFSRRLIYTLSNKIWQRNQAETSGTVPEGKQTIDFAREKKSPFDIKSESSYNAYLSNGSLTLGLRKPNCIAWVDIPGQEYKDHVIDAKIRLESFGGYAATGIIFRISHEDSYYMALVSSKGYFRLDVIKDNSPKTLIAWSEVSDFNGTNINLKIITYGTFIVIIINGKWLGEVNDNTISCGRLGLVLASYEHELPEDNCETYMPGANYAVEEMNKYACKARLYNISIDTRIKVIEENFNKWTDDSNINAERRLRLAETYAVMDEPLKALDQINRAWKRRNEVIRSVSAAEEIRTKRELLLAARMSFRLGRHSDAEEYIDAILDQWPDSAEGKLAYTEKIKILNELNKFAELKEFVVKNPFKINKDIDYYILVAKCNWELQDYENSAEAWDDAFELDLKTEDSAGNGVYAANAANAHELSGNNEEALDRYIIAGKIFLNQDNMPELAAVIPKLNLLGEKNWEARALAGKWAYSIE
ncbi:MAG: hypothetical protein FWD22_07170, partial [Treponema sp.]|nr:hypothetical protein [Treponema sp.]